MGDDEWNESELSESAFSSSRPNNYNNNFDSGGRGRGGQNFRGGRNFHSESRTFERRDDRRNNGENFGWNKGRNSGDRDNGGNWRNNNGDRTEITIDVVNDQIKRVIGKGGSKIRELQEDTGTRVQITRGDFETVTPVKISGTSEDVEKCRQLIESLVSCDARYERRYEFKEETFTTSNESGRETSAPIDWEKLNSQHEIFQKERWSKLPPLKKDFYIEDEYVANMDPGYVEKFKESNNNIVVKMVFGGDEIIPNPVENFEQAFQHYPDILREIYNQKFSKPSPIQCQAWPVLLQGRDLIGIAQTGTGKTLAFLLPALIHIEGQPIPRSQRGGANVLVMAPTRELALQIEQEVKKYSYHDIKCVCVYGGGNRREQVNIVTKGVEIIIATPGRLNDLVQAGVINVDSITYLVLDEADRMLDMGFEPQIRKIMLDIRPDRQTIMTSATWPPGVRNLAEKYMTNPVQVFIGSLDLAAVHSVTQTIIIIDEDEKRDYLLDFLLNLSEEDKVIVFVGKKTVADDIASDLSMKSVICDCIHGDREQSDREQALQDLKTGDIRILVATDVASRGLDIGDITKVFNFDFPRNIEEYVHRVGRTGRAGKTGEAISLFTRADWGSAGELITILEEANQPVPEELFSMKDRFTAMKERRNQERLEGRGGGRGGGGGGRGGRGGGGGGWGGGRRDRW